MGDITAQVEQLLAHAKADAALPPSDRSRTARILLNHGHFLHTTAQLLAYSRGQSDIFATLITQVDKLLLLCSPAPDGSARWTEAFSPSRPGEVRRVLNEIQRLRRGFE